MIVIESARTWKTAAFGAGVMSLVLLGLWLRTPDSADPVSAEEAQTEQPGSIWPTANTPGAHPVSVALPADAAQFEAQQASATARLSSAALVDAERSANARTRPDYVSDVEWAMLKGLAEQQADPDAALARLVRLLHFNKQLERWESIGAGGSPITKRELANWLLAAMPAYVRSGDLSLPEAQAKVKALVPDAEAEGPARADRLTREWARVQEAAAAKPRS